MGKKRKISRRRRAKINKVCAIGSIIGGIILIIALVNNNIEQKKHMIESAKMANELKLENGQSKDKSDSIKDGLPRVICWGDDLTLGTGGRRTSYPTVVENTLNLTTKNYGSYGEGFRQIGFRMGVYEFTVDEVIIPKEISEVEIKPTHEGRDVGILHNGNAGVNPCTISGVEGSIKYKSGENKYYFTRYNSGDVVKVAKGTPIITNANTTKSDNDIVVLFVGTNDKPDKNTAKELVKVEKKMINYLGSKKYIIIGLTCKEYMADIEDVNKVLKKAFGKHFLDIRKYLLKNGLEDSDITPTKQDLADIKNGEIPTSLRTDKVHGTADFYTMLGKQVCNKILELGYLTDEQKAYLKIS